MDKVEIATIISDGVPIYGAVVCHRDRASDDASAAFALIYQYIRMQDMGRDK